MSKEETDGSDAESMNNEYVISLRLTVALCSVIYFPNYRMTPQLHLGPSFNCQHTINVIVCINMGGPTFVGFLHPTKWQSAVI